MTLKEYKLHLLQDGFFEVNKNWQVPICCAGLRFVECCGEEEKESVKSKLHVQAG